VKLISQTKLNQLKFVQISDPSDSEQEQQIRVCFVLMPDGRIAIWTMCLKTIHKGFIIDSKKSKYPI
jgi:hypothetical protein